MASLREIRRKIKSVKSTQQITKAMKMVAAARLRKAQQRILSARPFAQKMESLIGDLLERAEVTHLHPTFQPRTSQNRLVLLVTSDKGLCGAFNTNLIRETMRYLRQHGADRVQLMIVGRKGRDYFRRLGLNVVKDYVGITPPTFAQAELLTQDLCDIFSSQPVGQVDLIYNEFKSVIQQRLVTKTFLPMVPEFFRQSGERRRHDEHRQSDAASLGAPSAYSEIQERWPDFIYEPSKLELLTALIPRFLKAQIFRVLLESSAAELGARMSAMDSATRNASELMDSLTLRMNRTRQSSITNEILEVVSGAEALK